MENKWDPKNQDGEIAKFNNTRSNSHLSDETVKLLLNCISLSERTNGKLDITLYPLTRLWGFESDAPQKPEDMLVSLLKTKCGMDTISVSNNLFTLDEYTMLDPSAVTNGYAADLIASELVDLGCKSAVFNIGDHTRTVGKNNNGEDWKVSLADPFESEKSFAEISVSGNTSVSTKGSFQCYFEEDGKRYCNILDPKNGRPVDGDLVAATGVCKEGIAADAYALTCFILGAKDAEEFYRERSDFEMILVLNNGEIRVSEGLVDNFVPSDQNKKVTVIGKK